MRWRRVEIKAAVVPPKFWNQHSAIAPDGFSEMSFIPPALFPVVLLVASNLFMTFAWYGHLRYPNKPLWAVVLISWSIALVEYCLAVPANRYGFRIYSAAELKTMQEVITLAIFMVFSALYLKQPITLNHVIGFAFIALGAFFIFKGPIRL
ncbi:conserved membrane hypothetical protein [uncultured Pleomorphomonas sp.]|uniref:Transmembrane signal peptide protein n=2 Tax=Pleomorphomonas TaxID=261933 RepID=A0A212LI48_9HYPH|nr:conserved membrane hypothetical protein [uncultured Pleomorphomonas sp.]